MRLCTKLVHFVVSFHREISAWDYEKAQTLVFLCPLHSSTSPTFGRFRDFCRDSPSELLSVLSYVFLCSLGQAVRNGSVRAVHFASSLLLSVKNEKGPVQQMGNNGCTPPVIRNCSWVSQIIFVRIFFWGLKACVDSLHQPVRKMRSCLPAVKSLSWSQIETMKYKFKLPLSGRPCSIHKLVLPVANFGHGDVRQTR